MNKFLCPVITMVLAISALFATQNLAHAGQEPAISIDKLDVLPKPSRCTSAIDREKRVYEIQVSNMSPDTLITVRTKGPDSRNLKIPLSEMLAGDVKLPDMSITGRLSDTRKRRGLWIEEPENKISVQLSYMPGYRSCNSKGIVRVSYRDLWIRATEAN